MSDLFQFLKSMNSGDFECVNRMTDDEVKAISPYVLLMWCNGATNNVVEHTILTDTYCADKVFSLSKHPRLLLKLFIAANCDMGQTKYLFKKSTSSEQTSGIKHIAEYFQCTYNDAKGYAKILSKEEIKEIGELFK